MGYSVYPGDSLYSKCHIAYILGMDCGLLSPPEHGWMFGSKTTHPHNVSFTCRTGYRLVGPTQRTCLRNGSWSGYQPKCLGKVTYFKRWIYHMLNNPFLVFLIADLNRTVFFMQWFCNNVLFERCKSQGSLWKNVVDTLENLSFTYLFIYLFLQIHNFI